MTNPPGRKQRGPFVASCAAGKYAWCRCEASKTYPYCDGSHRGSATTPLKVVLDRDLTVVWCACGASANAPFCDGSHARLPSESPAPGLSSGGAVDLPKPNVGPPNPNHDGSTRVEPR